MEENGVTGGTVLEKETEGGDQSPVVEESWHTQENGTVVESVPPTATKKYVSHFRNDIHPVHVQYGVPLFLVLTLALLTWAYIGAGISAEYRLLKNDVVEEQQVLLRASIFTSVEELWKNKSYPLALLIVFTSIMWPYVKLFLSLALWFTPYERPRRRELLIEVMDAVGKWSFVDIVVLSQIMVAFRSNIKLGSVGATVLLQIVVLVEWGFYLFVLATIMSLVSTHYIIYLHRKVIYRSKKELIGTSEEKVLLVERGGLEKSSMYTAIVACGIAFVCFLVGCLMKIYEVENTRGNVVETYDYSIISLGKEVPDSQLDPNQFGIRFLQFMWFFLAVAMPLWSTFLFGLLFAIPLSTMWAERIFVMAEIAFAWSCAEVLLISTIFAVLQMPTFGDGLIEADCTTCSIIDTQILGAFGVLCVGTIMTITVNVWLYRRAHKIIYGD